MTPAARIKWIAGCNAPAAALRKVTRRTLVTRIAVAVAGQRDVHGHN